MGFNKWSRRYYLSTGKLNEGNTYNEQILFEPR